MAQENEDVVRRLVEAFNRDDVDTVLAAFTGDCQIDEPQQMPDSPTGGYRGPDGVREWMRNLRGVAGISFEVRTTTAIGDSLLCELASRGRGQASDVPIDWTTFAVFDLRDGQVARIRVFLDRREALEAMGRPGFEPGTDGL
jgi:ketosteroid isomerase-like protein